MARTTKTTVALLIVTMAISLLEMPFPALEQSLALNPSQILARPWMVFTSLFVHANIGHLLQNMIALLIFGLALEKIIGPKKIISVYFTAGIFGNAASFFFYPNSYSLGASGAIMGLIGCLTILRPRATVWFGAEMAVAAFSALWILTDLIGLFVPSDIGNAAHLAGFAAGAIFGKMWKKKFREDREIKKKVKRALK